MRRKKLSPRRVQRIASLIFLSWLAASAPAWSLPGNEADPPLPPSTFGNLFDDGSLSVHSCRIAARTGAQASIAFISNYQRTQVSYWKRTGTWSRWSDVASSPYVCATPDCLWGGTQVRLRGCENRRCDAPGCTIRLGVTPGGPPAVSPVALPITASTVSGCAQTNHSTVRFEARWVGAPAGGYPKAADENGVALALTQIARTSEDGVEVATYTIPAPASGWTDGAQWSFDFSLSSTRSTTATVQVKNHCLNPPVVQQVAGDGTRIALANGQELQSAAALQLAVVSGNPGLALTNNALTPAQAFDTPFAAPSVVSGGEEALAWSEKGNAWDTLAYTSADGKVKITGAPCVSGSAARYRISGSTDINLGDDTAWTNGPLVESDACSPVSPGAPTAATDVAVAASWQVVADGNGWRVQARAAQVSGLVSSTATYQGSGWDATQTLNALRPAPASCPDGERVVGGVCRGCPEYNVCENGVLTAKKHCDAGNPPANARTVSYQACVEAMTQTVTVCLNADDADPADDVCPTCSGTEQLVQRGGAWVCETLACPPGQRAENSACVECPEYGVCENGSLIMKKHCAAGNPPESATAMDYQVCVNGSTETRTACVIPGGDAPDDAPCPPCAENERAVQRAGAWVCEACPEYIGCNTSIARAEKMLWCKAGAPPDNARDFEDVKCLAPSAAHQAAHPDGQRMVRGRTQWFHSDQWLSFSSCAISEPSRSAALFEWSRCVDGRTVTDTVCVNNAIPTWLRPKNTPCTPTDCPAGTRLFNGDCIACPAGERLVDGTCEPCPKYIVCEGGFAEERSWCDDGDPPGNARTVSYQTCEDGVTRNRQTCVVSGGTAPASSPCAACEAGMKRLNGRCVNCPTYRACAPSGTARVNRHWCGDGAVPADARMESVKRCVGGETVNASVCWDPRNARPVDAPCASEPDTPGGTEPTSTRDCPRGKRLVNGSCERCPTYKACSGNSLRTYSWCRAGEEPADARRVSYEACQNGSTVTRYACVPSGGSNPVDNPCDESCPSGQRMVNGTCETCPTYKACFGAGLSTYSWCAAGSAPADARLVSYKACQRGSTVTRYACVAAGQAAPADSPCATSCTSGQRLVNGACEACPTYKACSGDGLVTKRHCGTGNAPASDRRVSYRVCDEGITRTRYACVGAGESAPADSPCATESRTATETYCSGGRVKTRTISGSTNRDRRPTSCTGGKQMNAEGCCVPCSATETYCSGGNAKTRTISGCSDRDTRPTSCPSGTQMNSDGCCPTCSSEETYCSRGRERTRTISACSDRDSRSATRTYCDGAAKKTETISGTCTDDDDRPASCPSGKQKNAAGCCETKTCTKTAKPACTDDEGREGEKPEWNQAACRWDWKAAPGCPRGKVKNGWNEDKCEWNWKAAPACAADETNNGWNSSRCEWDCERDFKSCSNVAKPTSPSDCTAAGNFAGWTILDAWVGQGGWWIRGGVAKNAPPVTWAESVLCKPCEGTVQRPPKPSFTAECGTCGKAIWGGSPPVPKWCREFDSCGYQWDNGIGYWVEFYSGAYRDEPFR